MQPSVHNPEQSAWRFEVKYRISISDYHKIRLALRPFMRQDRYTRLAMQKKYLVRSIYFETYDYRLYHEKMSGDHERIKFRIRTYSKDISNNPIIRVEMKVRNGNAMEKHGVFITPDEYRYFMLERHWKDTTSAVLQEFERCLHLWNLTPQVLIEYYREGYEDREKKGLRITFDHKVRGAHANTLFPVPPVFFREFHPHITVLEIKCRHEQPAWLHVMIREYGLKWVANSKFTQGIQSSRKDLYYPDGVVIIR